MSFTLLQPRSLFKLNIVVTNDGGWTDGVYFEGTAPVITFPPFLGEYEPLSTGQAKQVLKEGINSTDAIIVFSEIELQVPINLNDEVIEGDTIFLEDPNLNPNAHEYQVFNKEVWETNDGFTLLDNDSFDYICIRKELQ